MLPKTLLKEYVSADEILRFAFSWDDVFPKESEYENEYWAHCTASIDLW